MIRLSQDAFITWASPRRGWVTRVGFRGWSLALAASAAVLVMAPVAGAATMTLQSVTVDKTALQGPADWAVPDAGGTVTWTTRYWTGTYQFAVPASIPAGGVSFAITIRAESRKNEFGFDTRFAPGISVKGDIVGGTVELGALSDSATTPVDSQSKTVTLTPRAGPSVMLVGIQDGPTYTYTFLGTADPPPPPPPPPAPPTTCGGAARAAQVKLPCAPVLSISPTSTHPALGRTTAYGAPVAGGTRSYPLPKPRRKDNELRGTLTFVDDQGNVLEGPSITAIEQQTGRAARLCFILAVAENKSLLYDLERYGAVLPAVRTCIDTVARILARSDQLKKQRAAQSSIRARAAKRACSTITVSQRRSKTRLRVTCAPTVTGVRVIIRPRSSTQSVRSAMGGRAPKLILGRSKLTTSRTGDRLNALWTSRRRR